ncbi:MAG: signal peptidase I [Clostridia bacterium]|nr:signal peptidase I [Deltaproteobacteria bacterium]
MLAAAQSLASAITDDTTAIRRDYERLDELVETELSRFRKPAWQETLEQIVVAVLVALLLRSFVVEAFKIPSGSMIPTLHIGDQIFVNKWIYGVRVPFTSIRLIEFSQPARGEVIVFIYPVDPSEDFIKRVVGVPGDTLEVRHGTVFVNGNALPRDPKGRRSEWDREPNAARWTEQISTAYVEHSDGKQYTVLEDDIPGQGDNVSPKVVSPGHLFVMGDNRDHSYDSRGWGMVPIENVLGRAMFVWWSWGKDGLDVERLGTWIH